MTALEEDYKYGFAAPFIKDSPIQMAMRYLEEYAIKANRTTLIIGDRLDLYIQDHMLQKVGS